MPNSDGHIAWTLQPALRMAQRLVTSVSKKIRCGSGLQYETSNSTTSSDHVLEDHVVSNVSLVCPTKLKSSRSRAGSDYNRAATEEPASAEKADRILCGDRVYAAIGNGAYLASVFITHALSWNMMRLGVMLMNSEPLPFKSKTASIFSPGSNPRRIFSNWFGRRLPEGRQARSRVPRPSSAARPPACSLGAERVTGHHVSDA